MASACVNNIPTTYSSNWLNHPTISSLNHEETMISTSSSSSSDKASDLESSLNNAGDFNFQLSNNNVTMLPADELFSDGKLLPLQFSTPKPTPVSSNFSDAKMSPKKESENLAETSYLFSPKAPRCSSRLKELLGFKRTTTSYSTTHCKSIKQLLYKNNSSKTTSSLSSSSSSNGDSSLSSPLLKDSLSSSSSLPSSSSDYSNELPRLSLDSKKLPNNQPIKTLSPGPKLRPVRPKTPTTTTTMMESPRMNPSGRVVFEGLERSSSCPSSFNGGIKCKHHYKGSSVGIERSYSANVNVNANATARITPVLNVPVCSIRGSSKFGFGQLFSSSSSSNSQKKEGNNYGNNIKTHHHVTSSKSKKEKQKESS